MTIVALAYTAAFALSATMLLGERGFSYDLRSRKSRKSALKGGRRDHDPTK